MSAPNAPRYSRVVWNSWQPGGYAVRQRAPSSETSRMSVA